MGCVKSKGTSERISENDVPPCDELEPLVGSPPAYEGPRIEGMVNFARFRWMFKSTMPASGNDNTRGTVILEKDGPRFLLSNHSDRLWLCDVLQCNAGEHLIREFGITDAEFTELVSLLTGYLGA